jgi:hypothetical protein
MSGYPGGDGQLSVANLPKPWAKESIGELRSDGELTIMCGLKGIEMGKIVGHVSDLERQARTSILEAGSWTWSNEGCSATRLAMST